MTYERGQYISSAQYRSTLKINDTVVWLKNGELIIGVVVGFDEQYIRIRWSNGRRNCDLNRTGGSIIAARLEDLTPKERAEIVTTRLNQCVGT